MVTITQTIGGNAGSPGQVVTAIKTVPTQPPVQSTSPANQGPINQNPPPQVVTVTQTISAAIPGGPVRTVVVTNSVNPNQGQIITVTSTVSGGQVITQPAQVITVTQTLAPTAPGGTVQTVTLTQTAILQNAGTINNNINNGQINNNNVIVVQLTAPAVTQTITSIQNGINVTQTVIQPPSTVLQTVTMIGGAQASGTAGAIPIGAELISNTTTSARPDQAVNSGINAPPGAIGTSASSPSPIANLAALSSSSANATSTSSPTGILPPGSLGTGASSPSPIALGSSIPSPLTSSKPLPTPTLPSTEEAIKSGILPPNAAAESGRPVTKRAEFVAEELTKEMFTVEQVNAEGTVVVVVTTACKLPTSFPAPSPPRMEDHMTNIQFEKIVGGLPVATPIAPAPQAPQPPIAAPAPQQPVASPVASPARGGGRFPAFTGAPRLAVPAPGGNGGGELR